MLTTICACGKCRTKTETGDGDETEDGEESEVWAEVEAASAVLEPYMWHRLVLAFYLFAPFVCLRCLLATHTHTYTHAHTENAHELYALMSLSVSLRLPHVLRHIHSLSDMSVCLHIWLGSYFNCQSVWETNVCIEKVICLILALAEGQFSLSTMKWACSLYLWFKYPYILSY